MMMAIFAMALFIFTACDGDSSTGSYSGIMLIDNGAYGSPESSVAYLGDDVTMVMSTQDAGTITAMEYKTEYMADWADAVPDGDNFNCVINAAGYDNKIGLVTVSFRATNSEGEDFTLEKNAPVYATTAEIEGSGKWLETALNELKDATEATYTFTLDTDYMGTGYQAVVVTGSETDTIHVRTKGKQNPTGLHEHTHFIDPVMSKDELRAALEASWFGDGISADDE